MQSNNIQKLREKSPLIHNITNIVVANYVANGLLSIGASPIMDQLVQLFLLLNCFFQRNLFVVQL